MTEARITPANGAVAPSQPRARASITDHLLRQGLVWGASTLLALLASATVVSGLN